MNSVIKITYSTYLVHDIKRIRQKLEHKLEHILQSKKYQHANKVWVLGTGLACFFLFFFLLQVWSSYSCFYTSPLFQAWSNWNFDPFIPLLLTFAFYELAEKIRKNYLQDIFCHVDEIKDALYHLQYYPVFFTIAEEIKEFKGQQLERIIVCEIDKFQPKCWIKGYRNISLCLDIMEVYNQGNSLRTRRYYTFLLPTKKLYFFWDEKHLNLSILDLHMRQIEALLQLLDK